MVARIEGDCDGTSEKGSPGMRLKAPLKAQVVAMASPLPSWVSGGLWGLVERASLSSMATALLALPFSRLLFKVTPVHS